jgi:outer membrane protein assembly factor BamA
MLLKIKHFLFAWIFCLMSGSLSAIAAQVAIAENDTLKIMQIIFIGNEKTKENILAREMKTKVGDIFDSRKAEEDRKRIQNLRLFTRVEMQPMQTDQGIVLLVYVAERWYIFPYPILHYNERDWKKLTYGAGISHQNFRGKNINLSGSFWLGYNPGAGFSYANPWIGGTRQLYSAFRIYAQSVRNKSSEYGDFDESYQGISYALGKRWGYHTYFTLSLGYSQLTVPEEFKEATVTDTRHDRLPSAAISFRYDTRDLHEYTTRGSLLTFYASKTSYVGQIDYLRYGLDVRRYIPIIGSLALAARTAMDFTAGDTPVYGRNYLGYQERVRGHFNTEKEGDNRALASVELRFEILPVRYLNIGSPMLPLGGYSNDLPFGVSAGIFYDTGAIWRKKQILKTDDFLSGFGLGLHFHLPYIEVLRVEKAFDTHGNSEYIIDAGVWF